MTTGNDSAPRYAPPDWSTILAPVQLEMKDKFPGLELLTLPQTQLVMQKKAEIAEFISHVTDMPNVEVPNVYDIRTLEPAFLPSIHTVNEENVTRPVVYYVVREVGSPDLLSSYFRNQVRCCMPYELMVWDMASGKAVAKIDSPAACCDCGCGCFCFPILPLPVCCCLRSATLTLTPEGPEGGGQKVLATMRKKPIFGPCTFYDYHTDIEIPETGRTFSLHGHRDVLCCCCCCGTEGPELSITDPAAKPLGSLTRTLGVLFDPAEDYKPTNERYPALPTRQELIQENKLKEYKGEESWSAIANEFVDAVQKDIESAGKELQAETGPGKGAENAGDIFLVEVPFDHPAEKAGLFMGLVMYDMA